MGCNGVSEVGAGARERVGRMVNGTGLASGSIAGPGACRGGRQPNAPSLTPPNSLEPSPQGSTQSLSFKNSYSVASTISIRYLRSTAVG